MTCDERQELLLLYATHQLDEVEAEALRVHLASGCTVCVAALAEAEAVAAQLALAATPVEPSADALETLMRRISLDRVPKTNVDLDIGANRRSRRLFSMGVVAALAAAASIAVTSGVWLYLTRDARSFWHSTDVAAVTLSSPTQPAARGQVIWDKQTGQWRVSVQALSATAAGREYELWFIPAGQAPIASKTFHVDRDGACQLLVQTPKDLGSVVTAAITDEPIGGTAAPTGKVHLAGQFQ